MPGGPVAVGGGINIGANAPKSKLAGILMVRPFRRAHFAPLIYIYFSQDVLRRIRRDPIRL